MLRSQLSFSCVLTPPAVAPRASLPLASNASISWPQTAPSERAFVDFDEVRAGGLRAHAAASRW